MSDSSAPSGLLARLTPRSVRAKFSLLVGGALVLVFALSAHVVGESIDKLGKRASDSAQSGMDEISKEYLSNYTKSMATRQDAVLDNLVHQLNVSSGLMQTLIDHPQMARQIGLALEADPSFESRLSYHPEGGWSQNAPGTRSVVSVWGYLLDDQHKPLPAVAEQVRTSAALDLIGPSIVPETRENFQQIYYMGPVDQAIMRTVPYATQAQNFDKEYKGHNDGKPKFWSFFFPGVYESWQQQIEANRGIGDVITGTVPYVDAITTKEIVTFFHPLWDASRQHPDGAVAIDIRLDQLTEMIPDIRVAQTGFAFLATADGNVIAISPTGTRLLGLKEERVDVGGGVILIQKLLSKSEFDGVRRLQVSGEQHNVSLMLPKLGASDAREYVLETQTLKELSLWTPLSAAPHHPTPANWILGILVPKDEIFASVEKARMEITADTQSTRGKQAILSVLGTLFAVLSVAGVARRLTNPLSQLAEAAERIRHKDYSVRVDIPTRDEVGTLARVFNGMTAEIESYTTNLERLVEERTRDLQQRSRDLELANEKNKELAAQLAKENKRLGGEVEVLQQLQSMILPKDDELRHAPNLDIFGYMKAADEVGGDYYDVLQSGDTVKVGIGDVTDHGLKSGVVMLMVQSVALTLFNSGSYTPERFLIALNEVIYKNVARAQAGRDLSLCFVDFTPGSITICGQHEHVIVLRKDGEIEVIDTMELGYTVGQIDDISGLVGTLEVPFGPGDTLVLFSDGITEAESETPHKLYGLERLRESIRRGPVSSAQALNEAIIADVRRFIGKQKVHDDITLLVIRHK